MGLTRVEALEVMGLGTGATNKEIKDRFKQLALKWHPDKNPDDPKAAEEKFQRLSAAYSHLKHQDEEDEEDVYDAVSLAELLIEIFGRRCFIFEVPSSRFCSCFYCQAQTELQEDREELWEEEKKKEYIRDYHEATAKVIGDHLVKQLADKLYNNYNQPGRTNKKDNSISTSRVSSEEASRNARQLLDDEEKARREREKKRERNKKKKEAKKKRKAANSKITDRNYEARQDDDSGQEDPEDNNEDELDVTSAFIARASKKQSSVKPRPPSNDPSSNGTVSNTSVGSSESHGSSEKFVSQTLDPETVENDLAQSRKLASLGNRAAKDGHFGEAVRRYTDAITLYPYDHRYFGNRSYCYDLLKNYTSALEDANKAIELDVTWAKGYYRQGRAFAGLMKLELAESSYIQALRYDPEYKDAEDELFKMRVEQLLNMGFPPELCEPAVREFGSVQSSIDAIIAGKVEAAPVTNEATEPFPPPLDPPQTRSARERYKLPPRLAARATQPAPPPRMEKQPSGGKRSLWVGNITSENITEEMLMEVFTKYGEVVSVKLLTPRHCAFINYRKAGSAAQALKHLQGYHLEGNYLLLRYPETSNKSFYMVNLKKPGPVNGTECYYWRTTGCQYGIKCHYEHIPENKGIDLPAMM